MIKKYYIPKDDVVGKMSSEQLNLSDIPEFPVVKKKTPVAYEIVGQKGVRTIQWGDYLLKIVRQEYGTDDALKYVVSYNNFKDPNNLPVGTEVRLPKLKEK